MSQIYPAQVLPSAVLTADEAHAYAERLARSTMIAPYFRNSVPNMLYAMELGRVYGMEPVTVLQNINVFESTDKTGKTTLKAGLSADLMVTLARKAGHIVHVSSNPQKALATLVRAEVFDREKVDSLRYAGFDPKEIYAFTFTWNEEKTRRAGLDQKKTWKSYPDSMNAARCKAGVVRKGASEVLIQLANHSSALGGLTVDGEQISVDFAHTAEELGADMDDDGVDLGTSSAQVRDAISVSRKEISANVSSGDATGIPLPIMEYVRKTPPEEIVQWATGVDDGSGKPEDTILAELTTMARACEAAGKQDAEVVLGDTGTTLGEVLAQQAREIHFSS